ncbi:helix-turn-helix transcriptional regulator [Kitasatospora aureofaciens]|uniref:ArsR/SmtB family transcription factor n=1 Tax=Kitasatospora aureofaciens TaxID=1894 RepID=UPI001C475341|nr:helix-turn-helix domain-containing protein [Kitasatospora aureofaciens]MBV6702011.1 helix-turn-helix domain-containing protein [Kitasatospora aureofaciens]
MLTLRFGVADVANTRFAISPLDHLLTGAARQEVHDCLGLRRDRWWRDIRRHVPHRAAPLLDLVNASAAGLPNFMGADVDATRRRLADELDAVLGVPQHTFEQDLAMFGSEAELPTALARLLDGGTRSLRQITDGAWALFQSCLAPDWPDIRRLLEADIAQRSRTVARAGLGAMLGELHPRAAWRDEGVLECTIADWNGSFDLGGRGLELRPNYFVQNGIGLLLAENRPTLLVHPVGTRPAEPPARPATVDGLAGVIGPARARVLRVIGSGPCSTTELAHHMGVTPPSASAHAAALRSAGLITTQRQGRQVRHTLTDVGLDLLHDNPELPVPV